MSAWVEAAREAASTFGGMVAGALIAYFQGKRTRPIVSQVMQEHNAPVNDRIAQLEGALLVVSEQRKLDKQRMDVLEARIAVLRDHWRLEDHK